MKAIRRQTKKIGNKFGRTQPEAVSDQSVTFPAMHISQSIESEALTISCVSGCTPLFLFLFGLARKVILLTFFSNIVYLNSIDLTRIRTT